MHVFTLILDALEETDADADALYRAVDGVLYGSSDGRVHVHIERGGEDMATAVRDAITDVEAALPHRRVIRVEVDRADIAVA